MKKLCSKVAAICMALLVAVSLASCSILFEKAECGFCGKEDLKAKMYENPILKIMVCEDCYKELKGE